MQTITLEIQNPEDAKNNTAEILNLFKEISKSGNLKKSIPDPVKWQKQIRKDRKLVGR